MGIRIYEAPTVEPLTLDVVRKHLGIEPYEVDSAGEGSHPHDEMVMAFLGAAREHAENFTGLSIAQKIYEMALDEFPADEIRLPNPPVVQIERISYVDTDLQEQVIDATDYVIDQNQPLEAWLKPEVDYTWPATASVMNAVRIRYRAGYQVPEPDSSSPEAEALPYAIRAALLVMVDHLYENRGAVGKSPNEMPFACEALLRPLRVRLGMA